MKMHHYCAGGIITVGNKLAPVLEEEVLHTFPASSQQGFSKKWLLYLDHVKSVLVYFSKSEIHTHNKRRTTANAFQHVDLVEILLCVEALLMPREQRGHHYCVVGNQEAPLLCGGPHRGHYYCLEHKRGTTTMKTTKKPLFLCRALSLW